MSRPVKFGVNLNNREPLIAPDYTLADLLALAERAERLGFDSVWVGDSLFSKPRWEPINLSPCHLAAHASGQARHGLHGLRHARPALFGAGMGDARPTFQRAYDPRHRHGQPGGGCPPRIRGGRARLRPPGRDLRGRSCGSARSLDRGRNELPGGSLCLRSRFASPPGRRWVRSCPCSSRRPSGSSATRG